MLARTIAGCTLTEELRRDGDLLLYRGRRDEDGSSVLALVESQGGDGRSFEQLKRELALKDELDAAWAVRPLTLVKNGHAVLLLEDLGGAPLESLLGRPWSTARFLRVALGVTRALAQMHERGLIHKNIKPANILVNLETDEARLTGFAISTRMPRERQRPDPPETIAGTLAYMAPEQTGRMNRSIDSRSDLYSLGVTFYQMLIGTLPFTAAEPSEWIHCHVARQPNPPSEWRSDISLVLSGLVMKLLAKTAEERYQTARGLEADLERCLAGCDSSGQIAAFELGERDVSNKLLVPEKLYGREQETRALLDAFERVAAGGPAELVLVSGYSGVGKSSVVNELQKAITVPHGLFVSGKFDQYQRDVPYATLAAAFRTLLLQILSRGAHEVERFAHDVREALGANAELVVSLVPELALIIGWQPPVLELSAREAQYRFQTALRRFIGVFARSEHPLVLFLDDLQWLDPASIQLLEYLVTHPEVRDLLLIGAYRDNEVGPLHPLPRALASMREAGARTSEIFLQPLSLDDTHRLLADALRCDLQRARPLAELIQQKTAGNPFFAIQFLTALVEEQLLIFDAQRALWSWDLSRIGAKGITDNVVELMVRKVTRLPKTDQQALQRLACLGHAADISTLALVRGVAEGQLREELWAAVLAGLVQEHEGSYAFLHDRVREAAYSIVPPEERAALHLAIGRLLLSRLSAQDISEKVFDVVNQLDPGAELIGDQGERDHVAELNLTAGKRAKASAAYASACRYLSLGRELLGERGMERRYELAFALGFECAECEYLSGNFERAQTLVLELLQSCRSPVHRAATYRLNIELHIARSESDLAVDSALECLKEFGIEIPPRPSDEQTRAEYDKVWQNLAGRPVESLKSLPWISEPEVQPATQVLQALCQAAIFTDPNLQSVVACHVVNASLSYGNNYSSAYGYSRFGQMLIPWFHRYADAQQFGKLACDLADDHDLIAHKARIYLNMGGLCGWTQPLSAVIDFGRRAFSAGVESGDLIMSGYSCDLVVGTLLVQGAYLQDVWLEAERGLEFVRGIRFGDAESMLVAQERFILTLQGRTASLFSFSDERFDEAAFEADLGVGRSRLMSSFYWILKLQARFLAGDYAGALASAEQAKALVWAAQVNLQPLHYRYYTALSIAATYAPSSSEPQSELLAELETHRDQLREWADNYAPTFLHKYTLVAAELARIRGRPLEAMQGYDDAIRAAQEHGFVHDEGIANELAGKFYLQRGSVKVAHTYLRDAKACFLRWGAHGKVRQLERAYPALEQSTSGGETTTLASLERLDLSGVIKASQAVSSEIVLSKLVQKLLSLVVTHAGAERGLLLLRHAQGLAIEAEVTTQRGVQVQVRRMPVSAEALPQAVLDHAALSGRTVIIDDAAADATFAFDDYIRRERPKSILCLPLPHQAQLAGMLYLENRLTPAAFTPERVAMLEVLAAQAAISLENARLYAELNEERARLRAVIEQVPAGLIIAEAPSGKLITANGRVEPILHSPFVAAESVDRYDAYVGFHPDGRRYAANEWPLARSIQGGEIVENEEIEMLRADGSRGWINVNAAPIRDEQGNINAGVVILQDVTAKKREEKALKASEARFSTAFHNSPTPMAIIRARDEAFVDVNEHFLKMLGLERGEILGRSARELGTPYVELLARLEQGGPATGLHNDELAMASQSGEARTLLVSNEVIELESENCSLVSFIDVTEHKLMEQQLRQAQKMEAIGSLAGGIAHDFNNLLTAVNGLSDLVLMEMSEDDPNHERITTIRSAGERASGLTRKLLAFSRKEAVQFKALHLDTIVNELVTMVQPLLGAKVAFSTELNTGLHQVEADRGQIEQILMNLVVNARDAMPAGGRLVVSTEHVVLERALSEASLQPAPGSYILMSVSDSGAGMAAATKAKIFEPFFTTKEAGKGTGLGLAVVYGIVKQSGGGIIVSSELGRGTTFGIYLPVASARVAAEVEKPAVKASVAPAGNGIVLVVDDDRGVRVFIESALRAQGYTVIARENGAQALEVLRDARHRVDVLVTDLVMPDMDGRELARRARELDGSVPILFTSGYVPAHATDRTPLAGTFIAKPFGAAELTRAIREIIQRNTG